VASIATGKSDFEALRPWFGQTWVAKALRIDRVASPETLRQQLAKDCHPDWCGVQSLIAAWEGAIPPCRQLCNRARISNWQIPTS
jgi:hypothetical protein